MGIEIERKFLVSGKFPQGIKQHQIKQGYIDPSLCLINISQSLDLLSICGKYSNLFFSIPINTDTESILRNIAHDSAGYLLLDNENIVRIRVRDDEGFMTLKGPTNTSGTPEYEYKISTFAAEILQRKFTTVCLTKVRHLIPFEGKTWEVDVFQNKEKLVLAEIELSHYNEPIKIPPWVGKEVTGDRYYYNSEILKRAL